MLRITLLLSALAISASCGKTALAQIQPSNDDIAAADQASESRTVYVTELGGLDKDQISVLVRVLRLVPVPSAKTSEEGANPEMKIYRVLGTEPGEFDERSTILVAASEDALNPEAVEVSEESDGIGKVFSFIQSPSSPVNCVDIASLGQPLNRYPNSLDLDQKLSLSKPKFYGGTVQVTVRYKVKLKLNGVTLASGSVTKTYKWSIKEANCMKIDYDYGAVLVNGKVCYNGDQICFEGKVGCEGGGYKKWSGKFKKCIGL